MLKSKLKNINRKQIILLIFYWVVSLCFSGCDNVDNITRKITSKMQGQVPENIQVKPVVHTGNAKFRTIQEISASGTLQCGILIGHPPYSYINSSGQVDGFDTQIATSVAQSLDLKINLITKNQKDLIGNLKSGGIDIVASVTKMPSQKYNIIFSNPFHTRSFSIFVNENDKSTSCLKDLEGKRIGLEAGTYNFYSTRSRYFQVKEYDTIEELLLALNKGELDGAICLTFPGHFIKSIQKLYIRTLTPPYKNKIPTSFALANGNVQLKDKIDKILDKMIKDGTIDEIIQSWFKKI